MVHKPSDIVTHLVVCGGLWACCWAAGHYRLQYGSHFRVVLVCDLSNLACCV